MIDINKIYCGDSLDIIKTIPDESIHMICTSPPYFISSITYNQTGDVKSVNVLEEWQKYIDWLSIVFQECSRILVPSGKMFINIDDRNTSLKNLGVNIVLPTHAHLIMHLRQFMDYKALILWSKIRSRHGSGGTKKLLGSWGKRFGPGLGGTGEIPIAGECEFILSFRKKGKRKNLSNEIRELSALNKKEFDTFGMQIWDIRPALGKYRYGHPAPFPEEVPYRCIKLGSFINDIIFDPFVGSGTTCVVAKKLGRHYIGVDLCQDYVDIANKRLNEI